MWLLVNYIKFNIHLQYFMTAIELSLHYQHTCNQPMSVIIPTLGIKYWHLKKSRHVIFLRTLYWLNILCLMNLFHKVHNPLFMSHYKTVFMINVIVINCINFVYISSFGNHKCPKQHLPINMLTVLVVTMEVWLLYFHSEYCVVWENERYCAHREGGAVSVDNSRGQCCCSCWPWFTAMTGPNSLHFLSTEKYAMK